MNRYDICNLRGDIIITDLPFCPNHKWIVLDLKATKQLVSTLQKRSFCILVLLRSPYSILYNFYCCRLFQ